MAKVGELTLHRYEDIETAADNLTVRHLALPTTLNYVDGRPNAIPNPEVPMTLDGPWKTDNHVGVFSKSEWRE